VLINDLAVLSSPALCRVAYQVLYLNDISFANFLVFTVSIRYAQNAVQTLITADNKSCTHNIIGPSACTQVQK
jgi:hypothetical protein